MPHRTSHTARSAAASQADALAIWMELPRRQLATMLAMQADFARFGVQQAAYFWSELANAALKWQADLASSAGEAVIEGAAEPTLESLQRAFQATLHSAGAAATRH